MNHKNILRRASALFTFSLSITYSWGLSLWSMPCHAMEQSITLCPYTKEGHFFATIRNYKAVYDTVHKLTAQGIRAADIIILTDWDDTINGADHESQGAWSFHTDDTSKVRTEEDVDHQLRDPNTLEILQSLYAEGIQVIVTTARPPIRDLEAITTIRERDNRELFDTYYPHDHHHSPNAVNLDEIRTIIDNLVNRHQDQELLEKAQQKIQIMQERSGIKLTGQLGLNHTFLLTVDNHKVVYHDGFAFVGYKKGPVIVELLTELYVRINRATHIPHLIIVDDSKRALESYLSVLHWFTKKGVKLYILHYPIELD